jgi:NAD(P)H-hydrate epimerase
MAETCAFPIELNVPEVTTAQMMEIDRLMIETVDISLIQMMENAGRALALVARTRFLDGEAEGKQIAILAGSGGNGGGALTAARRLAGWGASVDVGLLRAPDQMAQVPRHQLRILQNFSHVGSIEPPDLRHCYDLIIDGLIGYSLRGAPAGRARHYIEHANSSECPRLALDVPSGYDATLGGATAVTLAADATLSLALPKLGMQRQHNRDVVGDLYCADISVPISLYQQLKPALPSPALFDRADIVEVRS